MYSKIKKCKFSVISAKPIDIRDIERFEKDLDFTFGNEYRKFLEQFGCLSIDYLEFYGICGNNESVPSAVYMTKRMREDLDFFPENLVVIHEVGDGTFYCVDNADRIYSCSYHGCVKTDETFKEFVFSEIGKLS